MYLIVIHVPFQDAGPGRVRVGADWGRSLHLLRDSLRGRLGPVVVAAPALPARATYDCGEDGSITVEAMIAPSSRNGTNSLPKCG